MSKSFVHIEIIVEFKNVGRTIIQINTFVKIGFINNFKSCLLTIRLVSWQMCSISSTPPRETPASTFRSSFLLRYLPILQFFKRISSLEEIVIIIKFVIETYKEAIHLW